MEKGLGLQVYKFGGASVKDAAAILNLCRIVRDFGPQGPLVIVVSAMGKTTNALEEIFELGYTEQDYEFPMQRLRDYHMRIVETLDHEIEGNSSGLAKGQHVVDDNFYAITQQLGRVDSEPNGEE